MIVQIILTAIFYIWLFAALILLWAIWRSSLDHFHTLEMALVQTAQKSADAAQKAAQAALNLSEKGPDHGNYPH